MFVRIAFLEVVAIPQNREQELRFPLGVDGLTANEQGLVVTEDVGDQLTNCRFGDRSSKHLTG
ncbi:hypothetical protein D3C78_1845470 [compost metagenome]